MFSTYNQALLKPQGQAEPNAAHEIERIMTRSEIAKEMFKALKSRNKDNKTPLHLAIENNHMW